MCVDALRNIIVISVLSGLSPLSSAEVISGEQIYVQNCMVCHGDDGSGAMPGVPDLAENKELTATDNKVLIKRIKNGIEKPGATVVMPPKGGNPDLNDNQLDAVVRYLRQLIKEGN